MRNVQLLGIRIDSRPLHEIVAAAVASLDSQAHPFVFACANPHSLVVAQTDREFRAALELSTAVVADGVGCQWAAPLAGVTLGKRVTGHDFFDAIMGHVNKRGGRVLFFGSSEFVLARLLERVAQDFPHIVAMGVSPPFGDWSREENERLLARIAAFEPDVLWVGMTAPRQEKWVADNRHRLGARVIGSIGAVFGYFAGTTPRAPAPFRRLGLEWLYRLAREPRRLWQRNFVSTPRFLYLVVRRRIAL